VLGERFEAEIREQPGVWNRLAESDLAQQLSRAIGQHDVVLLGSGSSLFVAQLGALALRRRGIRAHALAATEAPQDHAAYRSSIVIACSQSGESEDLLRALDVLQPATLVALTNTANSTLGRRASLTLDVSAGAERAVPASKSVSASAAILLWAAASPGATRTGRGQALAATAARVNDWLGGRGVERVREAAAKIAAQRSVIVVGTGYGLPIALESALKLKEASYVHAEGFAAGEFRHGSAAILDPSCALIGIVNDASRAVVERPLRAAREAGSQCYAIGGPLGELHALGPEDGSVFASLAWLVTAQMLALWVGRACGVDSDAPRGLAKIVLNRT
jgi:glucosamine--fructose-6-phosphate aminotransferase (isomerizing)